jgi:glycosyltransferase involved in cell wall biosynthesis
MSDSMPYKATKYSNLTPTMTDDFTREFLKVFDEAYKEFKPDIIVCHHLYLLTAIIRANYPNDKIYGICHGTDLRQFKKTDLRRDFIYENIKRLDRIFALHIQQKEDIIETFNVEEKKITVIGVGYNEKIFNTKEDKKGLNPEDNSKLRLIFAGKICEKKGVKSLIKSLKYLKTKPEDFKLVLAGGVGSKEEYNSIYNLALNSGFDIEFLGKLSQEKLAEEYRKSDIFILPSFFEGLPLVVIEAIACGLSVVVTDLPGVRVWLNHMLPDANIKYVSLPKMSNVDEVLEEDLVNFEKELAKNIDSICLEVKAGKNGNIQNKIQDELKNITWENIARQVLK